MATACVAATGAAARAGRSSFGDLARVHAGLDGGLQFLDVGEVLLAGCGRHLVGAGSACVRGAGQQRIAQWHAAVAAQHQLLPVGEPDRYRTLGAGDQLLTREHPVAFGERAARAIGRHREHFTHDLPYDPD
ncbi:hypothetical protein D9M68_521320 [compost metagenome]